MHNSLKGIACTAVLVFSLTGCGMGGASVKIEKKEYKSDAAVIYAEIPEFENLTDKSFEEKINENYEKNLNSWIDNFLKKQEAGEDCRFELKQDVKRRKSPIISVTGDVYIYTGGVHGMNDRIAKNIDTQKNEELTLSDLFEDSSYQKMLNKKMEEIIEKNAEEYHDLWEKPMISDIQQTRFYLTDDELVIFYPPYELSYYAKGFVEFHIPYRDITSYLKTEYKVL